MKAIKLGNLDVKVRHSHSRVGKDKVKLRMQLLKIIIKLIISS